MHVNLVKALAKVIKIGRINKRLTIIYTRATESGGIAQ